MRVPAQRQLNSAAQAKANHPGAFSLLELMVVIGVIALLASLLLPAVQKAKRTVRRAQCLSIQKQWTLGFHFYAEDNSGWLPREGYHADGDVWWNNWAHVLDPVSSDVWYNSLARTINVAPASSYAVPAERSRFYQSRSYFHCPAAQFPRAAKSTGFQIALFSVAMNSQLIIPPDVPSVRLSRVHDPPRTVLTLDNLLDKEARVVDEQAQDNLGQPAAYANRFAGRRHGSGGNMGFVDGHVEWEAAETVVETKGINAGWPVLPPVKIFWETE